MADPEAAALKAERSKKWRDSYRKGTEAFAQAPSWETAPSGPSTSLALARTTYSSAQVTGNYVAMTFDDGPHPTYTPRLLDIMKARGVRGTFFVVGSRAKAHPEILRRMVREGHEVANHTWNHPDLTKLSLSSVRKEFDTTRDAIVAATGV
ncbi:MAG: polysaccharide deacetylase family protein, partial [Verrucomicrobiota bacterium]